MNLSTAMRRSTVHHSILQHPDALSHPPADAWRNHRSCPAERPGQDAPLYQTLQHFLVLQSVHRAPETLMFDRQELIGLDQPPKWRLDQLFAVAQVVEDL